MPSPTAATVSSTGISAPTYAQVLNYLVSQLQAIFGADAYLGNDSQDGQLLAIFAQALSDANSAAIAVYNAFSPQTAVGAGLSSNVKINGLQRIPGSFSTAALTIVGTANITITNGVAQDTNGNQWALPASVTIPLSGTITVTATCSVLGAVAAAPGTITIIQTPVFGWQSVTNSAAAAPGNAVETDAALRVRQAASVALPAVTVFQGIVAQIRQVLGVTRVAAYENNTTSTNGLGIPAGNLAFVVENGAALSIAQAIALVIPPGTPTYATGPGAVSQTVTDASGYSKVINFMTPTESRIDIALTIHGLTGWSTATEAVIQQALISYIASLPIGQNVSYTGIFPVAYLPGTAQAGTFNITAMTLEKNETGGTQTTDIVLAFNEAPFTDAAHITFTIV